jgi:hypothetical protein
MPAISLPPAQSMASRRFVGLWVTDRVPWTPSYFCDHIRVRRPSGTGKQGRPVGRESFAPMDLTAVLVIPFAGSIPHSYVKNDAPNHNFDFAIYVAVFSLDREGAVPLWL